MNFLVRLLRNDRLRYVAANLIWVWLGLAAALAALGFFLDPSALGNSPIGRVLHPYDYVWNGGYLISGLLITYGVLRQRPAPEAMGLMLFAGSFAVYVLALIVVGNPVLGVYTYPALMLAALSRTAVLVVSAKMVEGGKNPVSGGTTLLALAPLAVLPFATAGLDVAGIAALIAVIFGGGGIAAYRLIRPQTNELTARTADLITSAADRVIQRQQEDLDRQSREIASLRERIGSLEAKVIHQQETDMQLATVRAERDAAQAAVARLDHRVNALIEVMSKYGLAVPDAVASIPPRS